MILSLDLSSCGGQTAVAVSRDRTRIRASMGLKEKPLIARDGRRWIFASIDVGKSASPAKFREPRETALGRLTRQRAREAGPAVIEQRLVAGQSSILMKRHRAAPGFHVGIGRLSGDCLLIEALYRVISRPSRKRWLEVWPLSSHERPRIKRGRMLDLCGSDDPKTTARAAARPVQATHDRPQGPLVDQRRGLRARGFAAIGAR